MDTRLSEDGAIEVRPCAARAGERITVRVLIDSHVAIAAVRTSMVEASADPPRRLRLTIRNDAAVLPEDLPIADG